MNDIDKAKERLLTSNATCVFLRADKCFVSDLKGILPVIEFMESNFNFEGFCVADRIVGKAAALLFADMKIKEVYAGVLSVDGEKVLNLHSIKYSYGVLCDRILNRNGNGICPMEEATEGIDEPKMAYLAIQDKLIKLKNR